MFELQMSLKKKHILLPVMQVIGKL